MIEVKKEVPDSLNHNCIILTWAGMANGDYGAVVELANFADRSVQVTGVMGVGGNVRIEGSLNGVDYAPLTDPQGSNLDMNTQKIEAITEVVRYVRPRVTAGDGSTLITVTMLMKGVTR